VGRVKGLPVVEEVDSPRRLIYAAIGSTKWLTLPEGGHGKPDILGNLSIVGDGLLAGGLIEVVQAVNQYRNHFDHPGFTLIRDVH